MIQFHSLKMMPRNKTKPLWWHLLAITLWLLGLALVWHSSPSAPRNGPQPPQNLQIVGFTPDDKHLVMKPFNPQTGELDTLIYWNVETGITTEVHLATEQITQIQWVNTNVQPELLMFLTVAERFPSFGIGFIDVNTHHELSRYSFYPDWMFCHDVSGDSRRVAFVQTNRKKDYTLRVHEIASGKELFSLKADKPPPLTARLNSDGSLLTLAWKDSEKKTPDVLEIYDVDQKKKIDFVPPRQYRWWSHQGTRRWFFLEYEIWDLTTGKLSYTRKTDGFPLLQMDGTTLLTCLEDKGISYLATISLETGQELTERRIQLNFHLGYSHTIRYVPGSNHQKVAVYNYFQKEPNFLEHWLAKLPQLKWLDQSQRSYSCTLIDLENRRTIDHIHIRHPLWFHTSDFRYFVIDHDLWEYPFPRQRLTLMLNMLLWTLGFWPLQHRLGRIWWNSAEKAKRAA